MCAKLLQSCLNLCNPVDCNLPGCSVHGDSPGKNTGVGCLALGDLLNSEIEPTSLSLQHWQAGSLPLAPPLKPFEA